MDELVSLINNISKSEYSVLLQKSEDWKRIVELINPQESNKKYRIQYFIHKFYEINLDYPFLDIDRMEDPFTAYDSYAMGHQYMNDTASLLIKSSYNDLVNILNYNIIEDNDYYKIIFLAYIIGVNEITKAIKFNEEQFEKIMDNIYSERFFYAFYVYSNLGIEVPQKYIKRLFASDDSSAPEVILMYYKFYPTKIDSKKCKEAYEKIGNNSYRYFLNSPILLKNLLVNNFDLVELITEESFDSPSDPQLIANILSEPEFDTLLQKFLSKISKNPDETERYYVILYDILKIKDSRVKWNNQKLALIKKAFENSDDYYQHYALIYGTIVKDLKDKEFLLDKWEEDDSYRLPYFLLAFSNSGAFPEQILEKKKIIYNDSSAKLFILIQAIWNKEKMIVLETLLRGCKSKYNDDDNIIYYICEILFIQNNRRIPPFGRLILFVEDRQKYYSLNHLQKLAKRYPNLINSISIANIINNSSEYNRGSNDNLISDKFSRLCILLSLTNNQESALVLEGCCNYLSNINSFIYFYSAYECSTEMSKMNYKLLTLDTNKKLKLNEYESGLFLAISMFHKDETYPIENILRYIEVHPSIAKDIILFLFRQNQNLVLKLLYTKESCDIAEQVVSLKSGKSGLAHINYPNLIRYIEDLNSSSDLNTIINFTLNNDTYHGISHLNGAGKINVFENKSTFNDFFNSPYFSEKIKIKISKLNLLGEEIGSYSISSYEKFLDKYYDEEIHRYLINLFEFQVEDDSSISDYLFKSLFIYENRNPKLQYLSLTGDRSLLQDLHEKQLTKVEASDDIGLLQEIKKVLDNYDDETSQKYYKSCFDSEIAESFKNRKILIQNFSLEEASIGSFLDRKTFLSLFAGLTVDYVDEDTAAVIATVGTEPGDEMFHALFNDEDKLNKILICKWN